MSELDAARPGNGGGNPDDLTPWVHGARRGLRRDVAALVERLDHAELFIPLARPVPGARHGESMELQDEFTLTPHLLSDADGKLFCALFTRADILEPVGAELGWTTADEALEYCALPAKIGLDLAFQVIDGEAVHGLVLNAGHESELLLLRAEVGSIVKGKALPLVAYVRHIPVQDFEQTLTSETDQPPPTELVQALESCLAELGSIGSYVLSRTFNADRDLEPHLSLKLTPKSADIDFEAVTRRLVEALGDRVPPPGYIDIVFDRPTP